jgi:hypothetical protein
MMEFWGGWTSEEAQLGIADETSNSSWKEVSRTREWAKSVAVEERGSSR